MAGLGLGTMRLTSLVFAVAAIVLFHRLLARQFGAPIAFVACAAALLLSKDFVRHAHNGRPYALYVLAAAFALYACIALIEAEADAWRTFFTSAAAAFALPSAHYVGIVYSVSAAVALLATQRMRRRRLIVTAVSFVAGWLLFTAVHLSQLRLFARKELPFDPAWIPRLSIGELVQAAAALVTFPPVVAVVVIALVGLAMSHAPVSSHEALDRHAPSVKRFLFTVSALWLVLPLAFYAARYARAAQSVAEPILPRIAAGRWRHDRAAARRGLAER